jgi:signal transduction histidine kinase/ligand-binding sensor domain-containing protein/CheY-like chemotaxis protein/HPt (histidine-containing phosphotransfer) domain-containing protein
MLGTAVAAADTPPLVLQHLTTADGLPQATVMTTLQDSQGFVWLGTEDGLVRFDGHELHRYARSRTEPESLPGNFVWQVIEDPRRDLWIAVKDAGIARWSRGADRFTAYRHDPDDSNSIASDSVRTVLVDTRGQVWIGTSDAGVSVLDPASGRIEHLRHDPNDPESLGSDRISTLALDRAGDVWIGTDAGLHRWRAGARALDRVGPPRGAAGSLADLAVTSVLEDRGGTFWIGSFNAGLVRLDRNGRVLETFRHDSLDPTSLGSDDVRALLEDRAGHLWVGTAEGLALLDRATSEFSHYRHDPNDAASLRDSFVMSLYQDSAGLVWIGTRTGGVSRWDPRSWELGGHRPTWLDNQPVMAFADAQDGAVWVASLAGLARFDTVTGVGTPIDDVVGRANAVGEERVMSLRRDRRGALWIGTMTNGLKLLAPDGRLESIPVEPGEPHSLSAAGIMAIFESRDGALWIGTFGGGANVLDPATRIVRQLPFGAAAPGAVSGANVTAIVEDARGNFWLGTDGGGLNLARADGTVLKVFRNDPANAVSLPSNTVYGLAIDSTGDLWIATDGGGLARIADPAAPADAIAFEVLTRDDGLSSDTLYGVVADASGHLWLSGNAGLMRLDPETRAVKTYHREHGLQGEEFSFGAALRLRDGRMAFGGPGGFNIFDPASLSENTQPPRVALTNVEVLGVRVAADTPFWLRDRVALDYRGSIVSLDFGVLDFTSPAHNRLAYRMAGLTNDWIDLGATRRITLTNLDAGNHVLEVRAANADSVWSTTPLKLTIHRDPAPWASPTAYALYALALLALAAHLIRRHRVKFRELARARERLEAEVELRTHELRESNRQLAEAAQAKSNFLDRMSHELRTPMNGVVGMTELLSRTNLSSSQTQLTNTIRSSAQILLQIVNDLLDLSKIRAGKVALEALPIDLGHVLEECASLLAGTAEAKGIELIVCPPAPTQRTLLGDPLRIRQILLNLLGNAVKFTQKGEVVVKADIESFEAERALIRLAVTDTGIGMDAADIEKIFEPFAQADETTTRRFGGTGLGLAICRELAELMGGRITVQSQPQIGSTFTLCVPLELGEAIVPKRAPGLAGGRVRILSRRPSLAESLRRYASTLGLTILSDDFTGDHADVVVLDVATHASTLNSLVASSASSRTALIAVATAAEVEARQLRVLLPDEQIVLKPAQRIALREAFAVALGLQPHAADTQVMRTSDSLFEGHVLLVEDEPVNAAVAQGYLEALGCTSVWVASGTEAVARIAAERFDLILMDLSMPGMDGFATTALIRQKQVRAGAHGERRIPIVALTAHDAAHYREKCLAAGLDDILTKPYTLEDCTQLLRRWLVREDGTPVAGVRAAVHSLAAGATEPATLSSVDADAVAALRKLDAGKQTNLYSKIVDLFCPSSTDSLADLLVALERNDLPAAAAVCHKLASAAANVGALAYAARVKELERHALAGERACAQEICQELHAAHALLLETLQSHRLRAIA